MSTQPLLDYRPHMLIGPKSWSLVWAHSSAHWLSLAIWLPIGCGSFYGKWKPLKLIAGNFANILTTKKKKKKGYKFTTFSLIWFNAPNKTNIRVLYGSETGMKGFTKKRYVWRAKILRYTYIVIYIMYNPLLLKTLLCFSVVLNFRNLIWYC